ncbi:MAG: SCP2 sterol-binding domain-containing protein [bacterium]|nr:SCP2 sterol-binding domain-containing protein [bacterium]MCM1374689.1 SCP2 sterol-binding domain-containing protein [Muribaculum sp.]
MNINIYYGGRGLIDDPTLYVINKMREVLEELRVKVTQYNLYENKNSIPTLPQTLKDADGIILAGTVEWYGIGGYMVQFLDSCWLYGDKEKISRLYMCPVVMSTTYGEREGKMQLATAWEVLGGLPCSGICGYIANTLTLEMKQEYTTIIEKKAENLYRTINQKIPSFPASNQAVKNTVAINPNVDLTPQESEQLSRYAADDSYVQRQKEDIQELASMFRDKLQEKDGASQDTYIQQLRRAFKPQQGFSASYLLRLEEKEEALIIRVDGSDMECDYGMLEEPDVEVTATQGMLDEIIAGRLSFQSAFMSGAMKMKGNFRVMRMLDSLFVFEE